MFSIAALEQAMISIASRITISLIATVNLQSKGVFTPSAASCDSDAAPLQNHSLRQLVSLTSRPFFLRKCAEENSASVAADNYFLV